MSAPPSIAQRIGAALREARGDRPAIKVAQAAGIHRGTLLRIERGRGAANERALSAVIAALGARDLPELMSIAAEALPHHKRLADPETGARVWVRGDEEPLAEVTVLVRAMRGES